MSIAVIAGLGNPGLKYHNTRHNIGFSIVDLLADSFGTKWKTENRFQADTASVVYQNHKLLLLKPNTFMNDSGRSLKTVLQYKKFLASSLLLVYDDINLELGRPKLSIGGRAGGHNGVADILSQIEPDFIRYRIGIGSKPNKEISLADYVLSKFSLTEQKFLADQASIYLEHLRLIIDKGPVLAMNLINQRTA
jgi:PTH1 family peptidyl-tRNA hydrolase